MGIADDGRFAVVGRNDDEAVRCVKDIESSVIASRIGGGKPHVVGAHELDGNVFGGFLVNGMGHCTAAQSYYCEAECDYSFHVKLPLWFSFQSLSRHIVAFSVLDDDDMSVFDHFLGGKPRVFGIVIVFVDSMVGLHDGVGPDDFGFNAVVVNLAYAETVFPCTGIVPSFVEESCTNNF